MPAAHTHPTIPDRRRTLRITGLIPWSIVGLPVAISIIRQPALLRDPFILAWLVAYTLFLICYLITSNPANPWPSSRRIALLLIQTAAALAANALISAPFGGVSLGGILLVVIAGQLAFELPFHAALAWVLAQTAALWAIYLLIADWPPFIALASAGAYLAFQLFSLFASHVAASEARARTELADASTRLRAAQSELARSAALAERARLWRELHDVMGHHLAALSLNLEAAANLTDGRGRDLVRHSRALSRLMLADIRSVLSDDGEAPEDPIDLARELAALGSDFPSLSITIDMPPPLPHIPAPHAHTILRAAQEFITNTARHGGPQVRTVHMILVATHTHLRLEARDDGAGCATFTPGSGLTHMRGRLESLGGTLTIVTGPGDGFAISAAVPMPVLQPADAPA